MSTVFYLVVAAAAAGWSALSGDPLLGAPPDGAGVAMGVGVGLAVVILSRIAHRLLPFVRRATGIVARIVGPLTPGDAAYLALLSGFTEEMLFRGVLFERLGLLHSSLLFGAVHYVPVRGLRVYPLFAFAIGLLFGLLRERTGSVWPCAAAHATVNGLNLHWIGRRAGGGG